MTTYFSKLGVGHTDGREQYNNVSSSPSTGQVGNKDHVAAQHALSHSSQAYDIWSKIEQIKRCGTVLLDGSELDIGSVIAVAKYNCDAHIDKTDKLVNSMDTSVVMLEEYVSKGYCVYGVNTGFGGSADTRTTDLARLQSALLQLTQAGILTDVDHSDCAGGDSHSMPTTWIRATMLIRCNSILRGHSGVRLKLVEAILHMLRKRMTPVVPLRGSISASGDLIPLSYIAGMLEGNPDIRVFVADGRSSRIVGADEALKFSGCEPIVLGPKEGLGLINGTAVSAAVGCLVVHDSNKLALLAQALVAMSCEALLGKAENYHPFIGAVCPHPGQIECAQNVLRFLQGSSLVEPLEETNKFKPGLFQDRYALRGAAQWLGPYLEDLSYILSQITVELNSTSDNPVIDIKSGGVYSGANFMSGSVANGMEKCRLSLQIIGKLLFGLSSEMIDHTLSRGLPANLASDDPSLSFTMKGIDISMAAYMSELGYLANPVTSHVQAAETNNQPINSLALISGRFTMQASIVTAQMCAAHLFAVCQALDLRVLHNAYLEELKASLTSVTGPLLSGMGRNDQDIFHDELYKALAESWNTSASLDLGERCDILSKASLPVLHDHLHQHEFPVTLNSITTFMESLKSLALRIFNMRRDEFFHNPTTKKFLGNASLKLYSFVREELDIPFHQGLIEHPTQQHGFTIYGRQKRTIGSWVSIIYEAIRSDRIWEALIKALPTRK